MPSLAERLRRSAALARAVLRARRGPFDPFKLTWILTERCSHTCRTCHLWAADPGAGPDLPEIEAVLLANPQLTWLNLSGGDLVERPDAPAIMQRVADLGRDLALVDFPTSGLDTEATLACVRPLLESDISRIYVTVSIDGPDAVHDRVRGRRGSARAGRATLAALQSIRRPGFRAVAGMTLSRHNLPKETPATPEELDALLPEQIDPADLHLNLAHHSGHYYRNQTTVVPPTGPALALLDHVRRRAPHALTPLALIERRYWKLARRFLTHGDVGGSCGALRASVFLAADGTVYPCSLFDRPLGRLADVGHALRRLPELPGAREALGLVEQRACPQCWSPCEAFPTLLLGGGRLR